MTAVQSRLSDLGCESFVGVIVRREAPNACFDANWAIRGVRFGKADRDESTQALATIVERMQREFRLAEDASAETPGKIDRSG
jgi:hypothetical protein